MSEKHTPTPWEVTEPMEELHEFETPFGHRFDNGEWETVGWARLAPEVGDTKSNAELIVRAVNAYDSDQQIIEKLLVECRRVRQAMNCVCKGPIGRIQKRLGTRVECIHCRMDAAIKLAESRKEP